MDYKYINKCYPWEEVSAINVIEHGMFANLQTAKTFDIHNIWQQFLDNVWAAVFHQDPCMGGLEHHHLRSAPLREVATIFPQQKNFSMMKEMGS